MSESFDVDSVPSFVVLRGHTLLSKISGANAAALSAAVASHAGGSSSANGAPSSFTSASPQVAPSNYTAAAPASGSIGEHSIPASETPAQLDDRCRKLMEKSKVVLFMKGNPDQPRCGFSQKTVALLKQEKVPFTTFDILQDEGVRQGQYICLGGAGVNGRNGSWQRVDLDLTCLNHTPLHPALVRNRRPQEAQ